MQEQLDMQGRLTLCLIDSTGQIIDKRRQKNRIVTSGRRLVAQLFGGINASGAAPVTHMAVGTDAVATEDTQSSLGNERFRKPINRIAETDYEEFADPATDVRRVRVQLSTELDFDEANGSEELREAAILSVSNEQSILYNRVVFAPVTKTDAFQLTLLWEIVF